ncbi:MAG TPA: restriction endonuclease [Rheinheimera sp.]|nr:restriction endonuclease [Rheinheimera sp.]
MMLSKVNNVTIREYGLLINGGEHCSIDCHSVPKSAFDWLMANGLGTGEKQQELVRVKRHGKALALQVVNFVGVLETPCLTRIEILPKTSSDLSELADARKVLIKMLAAVENLTLQQFEQSHLQLLKQPLHELLISHFLQAVVLLVRHGVRSEYQRLDRQSPFLKGQLQVAKQINQRPGRQHYFHVSHDVFSPDRAENRLLHSALKQILKWSSSSANQRLARELLFVFHDINESSNFSLDFKAWKDDRSIAHYRPLKPWCELILSYQSPIAMVGQHKGLSFLFPMEQLFEKYVARQLSRKLPSNLHLKSQVWSLSLTSHNGKNWFRLKPDIVIYEKQRVVSVIDTKWKLLDETQGNTKQKYGLNQTDMYQLFAYGQKYLQGIGEMFLIYPKHAAFTSVLPCFQYHNQLKLHVVPYDLETDECNLWLSS